MKQLRPYQKEIIDYIIDHERCGIFVPMGMGKTVAVLSAIELLYLCGEITGKVLVVAPLRVAQTTWPDELEEWDHLDTLEMSTIVGNPEQRIEALQKDAHIYTINYENLPWLAEQVGDNWPFEMVVADESTKLKGFRTRQGTKRSRALGKYAHTKIRRFVQLTGTPAANGIKDLWATGWFIDGGERLGRNYSAFISRWFRRDYTGFGYTPLSHAQGEIEELLADVCFSLDPADHFDLEEPVRNIIKVPIPVRAVNKYKQMERQMYTELEDVFTGENHAVEAVNAAARTMKCLQLSNGAAYVDDKGSWQEVHNGKLLALEDVIEEASGAPILVAYNFKSDLWRLKHHFSQGRELDKNPQTIKDWNAGKIPLLFAHPASAGHGISLQHGGNILVFFGVSWDLEQHQQIIERIGPTRQKQSGYDRPVFIHYLIGKDTVDEIVLQRLDSKKSVQELLMEAMKNND